MENSNSFCFEDIMEEPYGKSSSQPEDVKRGKSKSVHHSKSVTIERKVSESYIENFKIDNKFVIRGEAENWVLIWENSSDIFYQKSKNDKWQHLNFNSVRLSELGGGKFIVKKQKFTESDYTEYELTATRRPVECSVEVMKKRRPELRLKKMTETRSVSVIDGFLEVENEITMEILGSQESVSVQLKLVVYV